MGILSLMLAGVSQVRLESDRKRHFESGRDKSKYLSAAAAMRKSSRTGDSLPTAKLIVY
jgi:hypothetical protein